MAYSNNYSGHNAYGGQSYGQQPTYNNNQYSTTSYSAQGGANGGGFLGGSQGGGGSQSDKKSTYGKDTLRPLTILQCHLATLPHPDAELYLLSSAEISQIAIIGQIRNIAQLATNMTYKLDDGTGTIEVKDWIDVDAPPPPPPSAFTTNNNNNNNPANNTKASLQVGDWCRVWGRLKSFGTSGKRHVGAHVVRPVHHKNEISHHLLEATFAHLFFTRGPPEQFTKTEAGAGADGHNPNYPAGGVAAGGAMDTYNSNNQGGGGAPTTNRMPNISPGARRVLECLQTTPQNNEGLHVQNIAAVTRLAVPDVLKAGDELLTHSLIFTTVDDSTWALLEM